MSDPGPSTSFVVDGVPDGGGAPGPSLPPVVPSIPDSPGITAADVADSSQAASSPSPILSQINNPALLNLPFLDRVSKQASLFTAAFGGKTGATLTAARPSPKPFIVGFIVPDVPVNYLPVSQVKTKIGDVSKSSGSKVAGTAGKVGSVPYAAPGKPGTQPRARVSFGAADLKAEIIAAYTAATGHAPTAATVGLIYGQMCLENAVNAGTKSFSCFNFNLGNYHAGGGTVPYKKGEELPPPSEKTPKGGSYYWTTDYDGKGQPYGCYMQSFGDLHTAVGSQVGQLLRGYPGTATAQTPEEFNLALVGAKRGGTNPSGYSYYEAPVEQYLSAIKSQQAAYYAGGQAGGNSTGVTLEAADPAATAPEPKGPPIGAIMSNGDTTGADEDPLEGRLGRNVKVDDARREITDAYVASIREDIEILRSTPPLLLLVNPQSFDRSYEQSVDSGVKGRSGPIVHMHIEKPLSISCKGQTAGQYVMDADGSGGLNSLNRIQSISYQNLMSLVMTYKNNGIIYDSFCMSSGSSGLPIIQMSLYIYYDGKIYIGTFDDFSVDDAADKPYNLEYSFKFTVRYEVEVSSLQVSDSNISGYSNSNVTAALGTPDGTGGVPNPDIPVIPPNSAF